MPVNLTVKQGAADSLLGGDTKQIVCAEKVLRVLRMGDGLQQVICADSVASGKSVA